MYGKRNIDLTGLDSDNAVVDEIKTTPAASVVFNLYHDRFYGSLDLKIHTAAGYGGAKLIENTDYVLGGIDAELSDRTLSSVYIYSTVKIINPTYYDTALYFSYQVCADLVSALDQYNIDDVVTLIGDGRVRNHIRIAAPSWKIGVAGPTPGYVGIVPVLAFDKTADDSVHYSLIVPFRFAAGTTIRVYVDWVYEGAQDNGTVCWALELINLESGETVAGSTATLTKVSAGNHLTGKMVRTMFVEEIAGSVAHDILGLRLYRDISGDTLDTDADMIQVHFMFITDKLGEPV